jgi:hypothetical protein
MNSTGKLGILGILGISDPFLVRVSPLSIKAYHIKAYHIKAYHTNGVCQVGASAAAQNSEHLQTRYPRYPRYPYSLHNP